MTGGSSSNDATGLDLASQLDVAQSLLATPAAGEARRLERALAACNRAVAEAMLRLDAGCGAGVHESPAGVAIFAGPGSPMTQGLAMGLDGPVAAADLDAMEKHLAPTGRGGRRQFELCPFADPTLPSLLADRRYRVQEWQLVWTLEVTEEAVASAPPELEVPRLRAPELEIRRMRPGEEDVFFRVMLAGFLETEDVPDESLALLRPAASAEGYEFYLAWLGDEPVGAGTLTWANGIAYVNGCGVRAAFRRRGAQSALIRRRLLRARELGCTVACANTMPGTSSRRNMERHGFRVAYPKLVMLRDD